MRPAIQLLDRRLTLLILLCIGLCPSAHECVYGRYSWLSIRLHSPKREIATNVGRPAGEHSIPLVAINLLGHSKSTGSISSIALPIGIDTPITS